MALVPLWEVAAVVGGGIVTGLGAFGGAYALGKSALGEGSPVDMATRPRVYQEGDEWEAHGQRFRLVHGRGVPIRVLLVCTRKLTQLTRSHVGFSGAGLERRRLPTSQPA